MNERRKKSQRLVLLVLRATQVRSNYSNHVEPPMASAQVWPSPLTNFSTDKTSLSPKLPYKCGKPPSHLTGSANRASSNLNTQSVEAPLKNVLQVRGTWGWSVVKYERGTSESVVSTSTLYLLACAQVNKSILFVERRKGELLGKCVGRSRRNNLVHGFGGRTG